MSLTVGFGSGSEGTLLKLALIFLILVEECF